MKENLSAGRLEFLRDLAVRHPDSVNLEGGTVLALLSRLEQAEQDAYGFRKGHEILNNALIKQGERLEQAELDRVKLRNRLDAMRRQRDGYRNQLRKARTNQGENK